MKLIISALESRICKNISRVEQQTSRSTTLLLCASFRSLHQPHFKLSHMFYVFLLKLNMKYQIIKERVGRWAMEGKGRCWGGGKHDDHWCCWLHNSKKGLQLFPSLVGCCKYANASSSSLPRLKNANKTGAAYVHISICMTNEPEELITTTWGQEVGWPATERWTFNLSPCAGSIQRPSAASHTDSSAVSRCPSVDLMILT